MMFDGLDELSGVKVPASAVEVKHVSEFGAYQYSHQLGWLSLKEQLEASDGVVVDVIHPRVYDSTSRYFSGFVTIGKCRVDGAKHNIIEFAGFDDCNLISMFINESDATIYAMSVERGELRYTMSCSPEDLKGVMLVPERYETVKGFGAEDTTSLRVTPFARPDGFTKLCSLVSAQAKSDGAAPRRASIWKKIAKALSTNIDDEVIWGSFNQGKEERLVKRIERLRVLFQDPRQENWTQKVFENLKGRVDDLIEKNVQLENE